MKISFSGVFPSLPDTPQTRLALGIRPHGGGPAGCLQTLEAKRKPVPLNPALRAQRDGARDPLGKPSEAWARRVTQGPWGGGRAGKSRTGPYRITGLATASGLRVSHLRGNLPMQPRWKRFGMALGGAGAGGCFFHRLVLNILDFLEIARRESEAPSGPPVFPAVSSPVGCGPRPRQAWV